MGEKPGFGNAFAMGCAHERVECARQKNCAVDFIQIEILSTSKLYNNQKSYKNRPQNERDGRKNISYFFKLIQMNMDQVVNE